MPSAPAAPRPSTTRRSSCSATAEDAQNDFQQEMQEIYNTLASKVYDVLTSYAQQQGYTLVLDICPATGRRFSTPADSTNITKAIIDAYNVKSGVPAPPAPAATHPSPPRLRRPRHTNS